MPPSRATRVITPDWAKRRARATIRGGALALVIALGGGLAVAFVPHRESAPPSTFRFESIAQQKAFVRDHLASEPTVSMVSDNSPPPSLAAHPLL